MCERQKGCGDLSFYLYICIYLLVIEVDIMLVTLNKGYIRFGFIS